MTRARSTSALKILLLGAAAFYAVFIGRSAFRIDDQLSFTLIDDAMISMRYAQHLAAGSGLVWNVGEAHVQGFTNFGWMLFMTLLHLLPLAPAGISLGVMATSASLLLLNSVVVGRICQVMSPDGRYAPLIAPAITAFYFPLVFWSLRGMEVGLLVLLIDLAVLFSVNLRRDDFWAPIIMGVILAAALMVRMDAAPQAALIMVYAAGTRRISRGQGIVLHSVVGLALAGLLAFQLSYFGDALPNTYYQKVVGASIGERIQNGLRVFNEYAARDVLMMSLFSAAGIWFYRAMRSREVALLASLFVVQCLYSIWIGGDYAEPEVAAANRFITQGVPALIILFSLALDRILSDVLAARQEVSWAGVRPASILSIGTALATLVVISGTPWFNWAIDNAPLLKADVRRVRAGLAIAQNTSPAVTIAVHAAGQIPYYSERRTIDLLGLNDPLIAKGPLSGSFYPGHDKWDYDHSIAQLKPDLIADNWIRLSDYIEGRPDYRQLGNGMYIRVDTTLVDEAGLLSAFP
ncbi:MAG: hypothetical protein V1755_11865 [Chloroflexota bacterium]